jgi:hypothetical protein
MNARRWQEAERMPFETAFGWLKNGCAIQRRSWVPWQFMKMVGGEVRMFGRDGLTIADLGRVDGFKVECVFASDWKIVSAADQKPLSTDEPSE